MTQSSTKATQKTIASPVRMSDDAVAGAFAGIVARLVSAPFDVIKIRFQLQDPVNPKYRSLVQAFSTVVREEGLFSLWKGNISATYLWISYAMVQFTMYGVLKRMGESILEAREASSVPISSAGSGSKSTVEYRANTSSNSIKRAVLLFLAGAGAGIAATTATYPFDIMRTQFAVQGKNRVFRSMRSFVAQTYASKGLPGFYAGLSPAIVGITPYMGLNFALYESFKNVAELPFFKSSKKDDSSSFVLGLKSLGKKGVCGGLAGGLSKFIVYPLDTVKKRLQAQSLTLTMDDAKRVVPVYRGIGHCFQTIYKVEGFKGFYKGIVPTTVKSVVATAITFAAYESGKEVFTKVTKTNLMEE